MKNSIEKVLWGTLLVVFGAALAGRVLGILDFNLFFPGWWTLFIIIPSAISLISGNNIASSIGGLSVGLLLLMTQSGVIGWQDFGKLLVALVFVVIGFSFLFPGDKDHKRANKKEYKQRSEDFKSKHRDKAYEYGGQSKTNDYGTNDYSANDYNTNSNYSTNDYNTNNNRTKEYKEDNSDTQNNWTKTENNGYVDVEYREASDNTGQDKGNAPGEHNSWQEKEKENYKDYGDTYQNNDNGEKNRQNSRFRQYTGFFSVQKDQYVDEVFSGAVVNAILGGVELDLRNAVFLKDTIIDITCIMGGVDIFVPTNMKVVVNCTPIMGGVDCYVKNHNNQTQNLYTLFIKGTCLMGGVEIK